MSRVTEVRAAYRSGQLSREEYWLRMRDLHDALLAYCQLIANSEVECIEITARGLVVVLADGIRMNWNPEDLRSVPNVMLNHGTYEPEESRILSALAARSRTILDIGANAGLMSLRMARAGSAIIHAFEPVPATYNQLVGNVRRNHLADRISCHSVALGDQNGELDFFLPELHGSVAASARALFPDGRNDRVTVSMTTLDEFAATQGFHGIDLIKCDVEGAEIFVLKGGLETLREDTPMLMLELLKKWSRVYDYHPNDVFELLKPLGYRAFAVESGCLKEVPAVDAETVSTNFFFFADQHREDLAIVEQTCAMFGK